MVIQPTLATLNHLLLQSGWALPRLARLRGKTALINIAPFSLSCTIQENGSLQEAAADVRADAICNVSPSLLPRLALKDEAAYALIESSGDAEMVTEILFLIRNLRWDAAEDLSRFTGDIAAERIVQFVQDRQNQVRATALNLSQALAEYWTEEHPLLAKPHQLSDFAQEVGRLNDRLVELEQRIAHLGKNK